MSATNRSRSAQAGPAGIPTMSTSDCEFAAERRCGDSTNHAECPDSKPSSGTRAATGLSSREAEVKVIMLVLESCIDSVSQVSQKTPRYQCPNSLSDLSSDANNSVRPSEFKRDELNVSIDTRSWRRIRAGNAYLGFNAHRCYRNESRDANGTPDCGDRRGRRGA